MRRDFFAKSARKRADEVQAMTYAQGTSVAPEQSRMEIERTLRRYKASGMAYGWDETRASIGFQMRDRAVRFTIDLPKHTERRFQVTPTGKVRSAASSTDAYDQEIRRLWRALALLIKAKLEAVESGIIEFDAEFLPHFVLPGGRTVADRLVPQIGPLLAGGDMPTLLPGPSP